MNEDIKPTCAECAFSKLISVDSFHCYRFPPAPAVDQPRDLRPVVTAADWCGEFLPDGAIADQVGLDVPVEWRELNQFDVEARGTLGGLPYEAEFKDLEDGGTWHLVHDHIYEMEEARPGNTADHIRAGLRVRIPFPKLSARAVKLYKTHCAELSKGGVVILDTDEESEEDIKAFLELSAVDLVKVKEVSKRFGSGRRYHLTRPVDK